MVDGEGLAGGDGDVAAQGSAAGEVADGFAGIDTQDRGGGVGHDDCPGICNGAAAAEGERAGADGGRSRVGVGGGEGQRAGAVFGKAAGVRAVERGAPCDRFTIGINQDGRAAVFDAGGEILCDPRAVFQPAAAEGDVAAGAKGIGVVDLDRSGADGGGAIVGTTRSGERERAGARLGEAAAGTGEGAGEARGSVVGADADGVVSEIQGVAALDGPDVVGVGTGHGEGHHLRPGGASIERGVLEGVYIREFERAAAVDRRGARVGIRHAKPHHAAGRSRRGDVEVTGARDRGGRDIDQAAAADGVERGGGAQGDTSAERQVSGCHIAVVGILNRHAAGSAGAAYRAIAATATTATTATTAKTTRACSTIPAALACAAAASASGTVGAGN